MLLSGFKKEYAENPFQKKSKHPVAEKGKQSR